MYKINSKVTIEKTNSKRSQNFNFLSLKYLSLFVRTQKSEVVTLQSKSPCILFNKNINFNKSKTESNMENATRSFRETNLVLELIQESQIKNKAVMRWSSRKKKKGKFVPFILSERNFFKICVLSQCIVNSLLEYQNRQTFTYQKTLLQTTFCLFLKSLKAFSVSLTYPSYTNTLK